MYDWKRRYLLNVALGERRSADELDLKFSDHPAREVLFGVNKRSRENAEALIAIAESGTPQQVDDALAEQ